MGGVCKFEAGTAASGRAAASASSVASGRAPIACSPAASGPKLWETSQVSSKTGSSAACSVFGVHLPLLITPMRQRPLPLRMILAAKLHVTLLLLCQQENREQECAGPQADVTC